MLVTTHYMEEAHECDRLVIMADGAVVARGTPAEVIGDATVTVVETSEWRAAFARLEDQGLDVNLAGSALRVPGAGPDAVRQALGESPVPGPGRVYPAPATLEERFFQLVEHSQAAESQPESAGRRVSTDDCSGPEGGARAGRARGGRRAGDSGTREAILDAARRQFADRGYDGATIRGIAADAAVDPALVHHFYGTKERLFAAAMRLPVVPSEVLTAAFAEVADGQGSGAGRPRRAPGPDGADGLGAHRGPRRLPGPAAVGADQRAGRRHVPRLHHRRHPGPGRGGGPRPRTRRAARPDEAAYRAGAVATQMLGLAMSRYVIKLEPIASASPAELAATIGPTLDRYLTGPIGYERP